MIISQSQSRRSCCVLGLVAIVNRVVKWPHPVLASPPSSIASELPNAPTPVIAGIGLSRSFIQGGSGDHFKFENSIFLNIDENCIPYYFSISGDLDSASNEFESLLVPGSSGLAEPCILNYVSSQMDIMNRAGNRNIDEIMSSIDLICSKMNSLVTELISLAIAKTSEIENFANAVSIMDFHIGNSELKRMIFRSQGFQILFRQKLAQQLLPWQ